MRLDPKGIALSVALATASLGSTATAQEFVLGDKTIVATTPHVVVHLYVAPSGRIYHTSHGVKDGPSYRTKWGIEYEIGKVRNMETRLFTMDGRPVICKHQTSASLSGRTLELESMSVVCGGKVWPTFKFTVEFDGEACTIRQTGGNRQWDFKTCRILAGRQLP